MSLPETDLEIVDGAFQSREAAHEALAQTRRRPVSLSAREYGLPSHSCRARDPEQAGSRRASPRVFAGKGGGISFGGALRRNPRRDMLRTVTGSVCDDKTVRCLLISNLGGCPRACPQRAKVHVTPCYNGEFVLETVLSLLAAIRVFFRSRSDTALEVLALRQQLAVLQTEAASASSKLSGSSVLDYAAASSGLAGPKVLVIVKSKTVVGWHRADFRWYGLWRFPAARRSAKDQRGGSTAHPPDGRRKCVLGRPQRSTENFKSSVSSCRNGPWLGDTYEAQPSSSG